MKKFCLQNNGCGGKTGGKFSYFGRTQVEMPDNRRAAGTYQMTVRGSDGIPLKYSFPVKGLLPASFNTSAACLGLFGIGEMYSVTALSPWGKVIKGSPVIWVCVKLFDKFSGVLEIVLQFCFQTDFLNFDCCLNIVLDAFCSGKDILNTGEAYPVSNS